MAILLDRFGTFVVRFAFVLFKTILHGYGLTAMEVTSLINRVFPSAVNKRAIPATVLTSSRRPCFSADSIHDVYLLLLPTRMCKMAEHNDYNTHTYTRACMCMRYTTAQTSRARPIDTLVNCCYDDDEYYLMMTLNVPRRVVP